MRRLAHLAALTLVATLALATSATAQQMNDDQMMDDGQMMDDKVMASPSASASATSSATASTSATASAMATTSAARGDHSGGRSSASAAVGGRLPGTGGVPLVSLVSVGALTLLMGSGLAAARLGRRST